MAENEAKKMEWLKLMSLYSDPLSCVEVLFEIRCISSAKSYQHPVCQLQVVVAIEAGFKRTDF